MCAEAEGRGRLGARRGQWASWGTEGVERSPHVLGGGVAGGLAVNVELCGPAAVHLLELLGDLWLP